MKQIVLLVSVLYFVNNLQAQRRSDYREFLPLDLPRYYDADLLKSYPEERDNPANYSYMTVYADHPEHCRSNHIFNTNIANTGGYYYPNLKAFVVPDEHVPGWTTLVYHNCLAFREGRVRVMPASEFDAPRVTGVRLNQSGIILKDK